MAEDQELISAVKNVILEQGHRLTGNKRNANDTGWEFRTQRGQVVNVYDSGKCHVGGKKDGYTEALQAAIDKMNELPELPQAVAAASPQPRKVFVVYGHDREARDQLEMMLRRWDIEPLLLDQLPSDGQTLIEKLQHYRDQASYAVVLATPDDEGHPRGKDDEKSFRARQNVVLELGMMLAILGRPKVAILYKGNMELPSDINGLVYIPFAEDVNDARIQLAKEINRSGIPVNMDNL